MDGGLVHRSEEGTPQGSPLSPLLSNVMLDGLDWELDRRGHCFVRYADDGRIYVASKRAGQRVMESITQYVEQRLKLKVNREKSVVDRATKRPLLGFGFFRRKGEVKVRVDTEARRGEPGAYPILPAIESPREGLGQVPLPRSDVAIDTIRPMPGEESGLQEPDPQDPLEIAACTPAPLDRSNLNPHAWIPHGCTSNHVFDAMQEYIDFLGFINSQLATREIPRFETMLMPANFSSMVGEFMSSSIPKHCPTIVKNRFHNGHPDLVPKGYFPGDSILHGDAGIEIKSSRYLKGWQGHNPEDVWLMVFAFDSNRPVDVGKGVPPKPFRFLMVVGALIEKSDWSFAGREGDSRRTITATVLPSGYEKMRSNWIYLDRSLR